MSWISNVVRPKIRTCWPSGGAAESLDQVSGDRARWCSTSDLEANHYVIPGSGYHMRMTATQRFEHFFDDGDLGRRSRSRTCRSTRCKFRDERRYIDRLHDARAKTGAADAVQLGAGPVEGVPVVAAVQDFDFMGGSLGMAAGEAVITGADDRARASSRLSWSSPRPAARACRRASSRSCRCRAPRSRSTRCSEAKLPYIVVLTNPTTGGVTASYAMLGDVHLAEPGALIGFAGPRVIEQTIREKLPDGFQRSEYLHDHGMVDLVVHRHELPLDGRAGSAGLLAARRAADRAPSPEPLVIAKAEPVSGRSRRHGTVRDAITRARCSRASSARDRPVARADRARCWPTSAIPSSACRR